MGNKMTSTPYGLKVKEHTNHADYKDVFDKTVFKIYYNESTHVWSIISNYDRLWSDGVQYYTGDTILSFTNTSNQEKTVLGQYDQEGTEVYRNIMYRIKCYQGEAGQGQTKQMIQITGGYSPKTYDKDTVCTDILHTHVSVYYNGKWHKAMYLVYDNASIAGCWMKKVGSLAITYAYPYWFLMCTKAGLKQGDRTYAARELIRSWSQDDYINMAFKEYKIRSKTKLGKGSYEKGEYLVKTIPSEDSIEVNFIVNGKIENKDTIILGISDVPYDFYNIRIDYSANNWSLISINGHISYNKHNYKKDAVICSFSKDEQVTVTLIDNNDRYKKQQELNNDYEETVYDIVGLPDATYITVKNQTVAQELNPETGRTEKVYIDFDEKTIYQSDTMPSDFYNIRFIYTSTDNKWTIYSLCDYIKYGGRTYTKNKPILSFGTDEYDPEDPHPEVHLEIKDETEKYEIESTTTYTVKSVQVSSVSYKLWTVTIDKSLKIEKTVDTTVEPWISLRYYEAMYEPVVIDDLILEFSNVDMKWYLKSNNDNLYCAGTNYQKGELITYWDYNYIQNLKYITVLSSSSEYGIELKKLVSGKTPYINNDIDEVYDDGLKICHSSTKGLWEIVSVDDETYHNGLQFLEGQVIVSFKDKTILDQFTILVKKEVEGEDTFDNVLYTCYTGVDLIEGITTLTINGMSWTDKSATDDNKSTIVTKDSARSMYGYIWQKEETPPPPVWVYFILAIIQVSEIPSRRDYGSLWYINNINVLDLKVKKDLSYYSWQWYRYELFDYKESFLNRIFIQDNYFTDVTQILICDNITDNDPNFIEYTLGSNLRIVGILNKSTIICISKYYYTDETFVYHQYTLFEDGTSRSTYDVENDNEEFIYDIHRTYYNGNIYFNIFGQSGNLLVQTRWSEGQDWTWWLFYPYQNIIEKVDSNLSNWNQFIQSINWSNIPVNPQPSDIGSKRSRYEIFIVSDNDNNGGRTEECRQFFYNNKIYMYRKVISVQYELYGYEYYGRWYYSERYVENSERIDYKLIVYDVITGNDYLYDIDPTSLYLDYPAVGDNGYIGYHNYSYHPNEYYRFFGGGYYKWRNLGIYFVARLYGNYNPQSYYTDKYSELNKYGIFKLNEETYDVELVKEMASNSYILINKWNQSTEEFDGQLKFYYFNGILDEETGWIVPIDPDAYSIFRESPNYAEPAIEQVTHIDVNNIPSSMNNGILIRYATTVSGASGYYMYIYFDNPYFEASPGNFCMLVHSGNVNY